MRRFHRQPESRESRLQQEVAREKQASRDADERAIAEGRVSVEQLERRNGLFPGNLFALDYDVAGRIW